MAAQAALSKSPKVSVDRISTFSTLEKIKIRNLYLSQGVTNGEIAIQLGKDKHAIERYLTRAGLPKIRREREKTLITRADSKLADQFTEGMEAIADQCEELALQSLSRAREAVESPHKDAPKDFQAWTAGIRNLTTARNLARGNANVNTLGSGDEGRSVNLFFLQGGAVTEAKGMKVVETVDDVL